VVLLRLAAVAGEGRVEKAPYAPTGIQSTSGILCLREWTGREKSVVLRHQSVFWLTTYKYKLSGS
jgi:hypothetical protein